MMKEGNKQVRRLSTAVMVTVLLAAILVLAACGGTHLTASIAPQAINTPVNPDTSIAEVLSELDGLECPEGVESALWAELKNVLAADLTATSQESATRSASIPPTGEDNEIDTVECVAFDPARFIWPYVNCGDYDQNGAVGISDITPLAVNFGGSIYDNGINGFIDASHSGKVDIADVTAIAVHYGSEVAGYVLETAERWNEEGPYEFCAYIDFSEAISLGPDVRKYFVYTLGSIPSYWVRVVPVDSDGNRGEPSEPLPYGWDA